MTKLKLECKMDAEEGLVRYYTERGTNLIYEARLFDHHVMVRPATPGFELVIRKVAWNDFLNEFEEFQGNPIILKAFLDGEPLDILTVTPARKRVK